MTKDEVLKLAQDACPYKSEELRGAFYEGFIKALDHVRDVTKMIEPDMGIDRGAWDDVPDATKWVDELRGGDETEQEPVAWVRDLTSAQPNCVTDLRYMSVADTEAGVQYIPLYAAPPKQSEQEPPTVAELLCVCGAGWEWRNRDWELVETPSPKREWVGLTDDEIAESAERMEAIDPTDYFWRDFALAIEAKLKEKNNG